MSLRTVALIAAVLVAAARTASAQSGAALGASPAPVRDSRTAIPKVPAVSQVPTPQVAAVRQIPTQVIVLKPGTLIARKDSVCYALRTYQFDQPATASDGTRMTGQSSCVPAKTSNAIAVATPH